MQHFDVVIVGAGPAGGHCARLLTQQGFKTLLVERYENFEKNSFSSAGTPLETLAKFNLPDTVVGSFWHQLKIVTSRQENTWTSPYPMGAVLDFTKLRQFLADEVKEQGGEVWMGCRYQSHSQQEQQTLVYLKSKLLGPLTVSTQVLVDATGPARAVMYDKTSQQPKFLTGTGIEYLIEVEAATYQANADALTFFLGHKWIPRGYSWIFPMAPNQLKVGAGVVNLSHQVVRETEPLKHYIQRLINEYLETSNYKILDIHGSTLRYSLGLQDIYYQDNLIAIGDTVSTVNFLGGEGIRHGMQGAEIAAKYIQKYLRREIPSFKGYQQEMHQVFLKKWKVSEKLAMKKYLQDSDELVDKVVLYLKPFSLEDVVDILFYYKFERLTKGIVGFLIRKLRNFFTFKQ